MKRIGLVLLLSLTVCIGVGLGQEADLSKHPGYIDLEKIEIPSTADRVTDISLGPALLKLTEVFYEDEDAKDGFGITSVRVKSFEIRRRAEEAVRRAMEKIEDQLERDSWESLIRVTGEDEFVRISLKFDGEKPVGLVLLAYETGDEAAFINVVGDNIDFKSICNMGLGMHSRWHKHLSDCFDDDGH